MSDHKHEWVINEEDRTVCNLCSAWRFHGPRATVVAPPGRCFIAFDADGLHYRIAACLSKDPFVQGSLTKYDETHDPIWKPHVRNCSALFSVTPEEAVQLMNVESPKYTFAKNFIYMLLNGGDVPALANALVAAGVVQDETKDDPLKIAKISLDKWYAKAKVFKTWRDGLVDQVKRTGSVTLPDGRRRRFYNLHWNKAAQTWNVSGDVIKEIYNFPLIGTEVSFMNPRILLVWRWTVENPQWIIIYHGHDGFMLEGPVSEATEAAKSIIQLLPTKHAIDSTNVLYVPFDWKMGRIWSDLRKVK